MLVHIQNISGRTPQITLVASREGNRQAQDSVGETLFTIIPLEFCHRLNK